jgi:hypothetical protein
VLGSGATLSSSTAPATAWRARLLTSPIWLGLAYVIFGSGLRPFLLGDVNSEHRYTVLVWTSAVLAIAAVAGALMWWPALRRFVSSWRPSAALVATLVIGMVAWNLLQYGRWAAHHNDSNYRASLEVGRLLPPGTLVQGKLANGLALENRIRPIFIGRGFGNYADRFDRDDVRYILTYDLPRVGYESQRGLIEEILDRYPNRQPMATFEVDETPGADRAVLIDKHPGAVPAAASGLHRAPD